MKDLLLTTYQQGIFIQLVTAFTVFGSSSGHSYQLTLLIQMQLVISAFILHTANSVCVMCFYLLIDYYCPYSLDKL